MSNPLGQTQSSTEARAASGICHYFTLPAELRIMIYTIVFVDEDIEYTELATRDPLGSWLVPPTPSRQAQMAALRSLRLDANLRGLRYVHTPPMSGILSACKQTYADAVDLWYSERTIIAGSMRGLYSYLCRLDMAKKAQIRRLRIMRDHTLHGNQCIPCTTSIRGIEGFECGAQGAFIQLRACTHLRHLTLELGFYWPELRQYRCLETLRRLKGLHSITFLGNDGARTYTDKQRAVQMGMRPDLRFVGGQFQWRHYEVDTPLMQQIRTEVMQVRPSE